MSTRIADRIRGIISADEVVLFMKGEPAAPVCGFSAAVVAILDRAGVSFRGVNILDDSEMREGIKSFSQWPTLPQLYVKGQFVGGCDIVREMYQRGELQRLLDGRRS